MDNLDNNDNAIVPADENSQEIIEVIEVYDEPELNEQLQEVNEQRAEAEIPIVNIENNEPTDCNDRVKKYKPEKKRRRKDTSIEQIVDDDDGLVCSICLESWEIVGSHRTTSLKCGHLFGYSCIKRWLQEGKSNKCCPTCKLKATLSDFRFIYAKSITAIDNTENMRLQLELDKQRSLVSKLKLDNGIIKLNYEAQLSINEQLEKQIREFSNNPTKKPYHYGTYKLYMEKNIEVSKAPGSRVMIYSSKNNSVIASLKINSLIFSTFTQNSGLNFIDATTFCSTQHIYISQKPVRDLSFDQSEDLLITACMENISKLYNPHTRILITHFECTTSAIWSCNFDKSINRSHTLYLGSQSGTTFVYDIRNPGSIVQEFRTDGDLSPVIQICSIPPSEENSISFGGFLVCKLKSLWFFEYTSTELVLSYLLNVDGPFLGVSYDAQSGNILISTRPSIKYKAIRYIVAQLCKVNDSICILNFLTTFNGSRTMSVMTRCAQINTNDNILVAGYVEDQKLLATWGLNKTSDNVFNSNSSRMQSIGCQEIIYDMCSIKSNNNTFLGTLTDRKCRIYKLLPTE